MYRNEHSKMQIMSRNLKCDYIQERPISNYRKDAFKLFLHIYGYQ